MSGMKIDLENVRENIWCNAIRDAKEKEKEDVAALPSRPGRVPEAGQASLPVAGPAIASGSVNVWLTVWPTFLLESKPNHCCWAGHSVQDRECLADGLADFSAGIKTKSKPIFSNQFSMWETCKTRFGVAFH